jgi:CRISPR-associated endonuclease/helicase Cas3
MGEGKTEAALVLANAAAARTGQGGFYIGLPTQATANQMFGRIERFLSRTREGRPFTLLLAHGEAALVEHFRGLTIRAVSDRDGDALGSVRAEEWFLSKKRALLAEFAVGTIDQALLGVMRVPHAFVRLYGLGEKIVIFDEIHAYDTYTSNLLDRLVEWLAAIGTTVILLSATLPAARRSDLISAYRRGAGLADEGNSDGTYPRITTVSRDGGVVRSFAPRGAPTTVRVERARDELNALAQHVIQEALQGRCVGWICNTVARAQAATVRVRELAPDLQRLLLHSRLLPEDRAQRERDLESWLGPEGEGTRRPERCVVVGTQVLEQSLDIDFDFLVTDVAPMDLILQRAGRLWRHERSNRAPGHSAPRLLVVCPDGSWKTASLERVAVVYADDELLVRRTLEKLEEIETLTLPDDIEPLVHAVYADDGVPADSDLVGAFIDHQGKQAVQRNLAEQKLMPHPSEVDDPFGDFKVFLKDDDDPVLHQQLRANTRLGPATVELVCVERHGDQLLVGDGDATPLDLSREPDRPLVKRLIRRSIGVSNKRVFAAITRDPHTGPEGWKRSPLLRYRRLLVLTDGRAQVGGMNLTLDPELGLCIQQARDTS